MKIYNKEYNVELNRMFIQPHIMINGVVTDAGIWDSDRNDKDKTKELLQGKRNGGVFSIDCV